jgi:hypothetical protein
MTYKVPGHGHNCYDCVPDISKQKGRAKARREAKQEVRKWLVKQKS